MKKIMIIILLIGSINLFAISSSCIFTLNNPSAAGLGSGITGWGADIWNQNPLDVWSNPAKLGYFTGFSIGYSHDGYLEKVLNDAYLDDSFLTFGWKGIGLMVPMLNNELKFGSSITYDEQEIYINNDTYLKTFDTCEISSGFALGINLLEFYGEMRPNDRVRKYQSYTDLSIGYNYNLLSSSMTLPDNHPDKKTGKSYSDGLGFIFRFSPLNETTYSSYSYLNIDLVLSSYSRNFSKTHINYGYGEDPVAFSHDNAISCRLSIDKDIFKEILNSNDYDNLSVFCKDIISMNYYGGNSDCMDDYINRGSGFELTLLDLVSLRWGEYKDGKKDLTGKTSGIGLNLKYNDLFQLQCNYAKYPLWGLQEFEEKYEFMLNINLN